MSVKHYHHHYHFWYKTSLQRHFTSLIFVITLLILLILSAIHFVSPHSITDIRQVSFVDIALATINTLSRLTVAYAISMVLSIPLAIFITSSSKTEKVLLPIFDIFQSIPVLAFFPVIVVTFVKANFLEGAALFILIIAMMGSTVFSMIGGLKTIPEDIQNAAFVFGATGFKKLWYITLPAIFPSIITGSLLSWSEAWSIIIVAEALHTYIPNGSSVNDLFGLGSLLVDSFASGNMSLFIASLITLVALITVLNYFIWQKLLHLTQQFRFD